MENRNSMKGPVFLFLCAFFWGTAFSAQSTAMRYIGPNTFVFCRSVITCLVLALAFPALNRLSGEKKPEGLKRHLGIGALCGCCLAFASILQQVGIQYTTAAKSGFITALYILLVPIFGIFMKKRPPRTLWIGVCVSLAGLYFLSMNGGDLTLNIGDAFTFACALVFALHIICVDSFGGALNSVLLSIIQFGTCALISGIFTLLTEHPTMSGILGCWTSIAFAAVFSGAIGYTFQIIGQKHTPPAAASLIMCLESVFAAIGGWIILHEALSAREIFGCALMLTATVLALLPSKQKERG